jgi:hypothetical protein
MTPMSTAWHAGHAMIGLESINRFGQIGDADDHMIDCRGHGMDHDRIRHTLVFVKRLSPLVLIMLAAAAALAFLRKSEDPEPAEEWKPVRPT